MVPVDVGSCPVCRPLCVRGWCVRSVRVRAACVRARAYIYRYVCVRVPVQVYLYVCACVPLRVVRAACTGYRVCACVRTGYVRTTWWTSRVHYECTCSATPLQVYMYIYVRCTICARCGPVHTPPAAYQYVHSTMYVCTMYIVHKVVLPVALPVYLVRSTMYLVRSTHGQERTRSSHCMCVRVYMCVRACTYR